MLLYCSNGTTTIRTQIPDTVTSWMVSGFALNADKGLGVLPNPVVLSTYKPFFVDANIPTSCKMDEIVPVQVAVHNYLDQSSRVEVQLDDSNKDFEIMSDGRQFNEYNDYADDYELKNSKMNVINVEADSVKSTTFNIKAKRTGTIPIKVWDFFNYIKILCLAENSETLTYYKIFLKVPQAS
jgi:CD109 antigen